MSGELSLYHAAIHRGNGRTTPVGEMIRPIAELALAGSEARSFTLRIEPGEYKRAFVYGAPHKRFGYLEARIIGDGFAHAFWLVDKPTDFEDEDWTPLGTHERWRQASMSCQIPFILSTDHALVHPTIATDAGDSGGLPALMSDVGTVDGKVYEVLFRNPSTATAAAVIECLIAEWD